jgi:hypothetical protein
VFIGYLRVLVLDRFGDDHLLEVDAAGVGKVNGPGRIPEDDRPVHRDPLEGFDEGTIVVRGN